jgi:hypothetical protein
MEMSQKRCDLVRRHSACDHRIETRRSDASYEAARPKSVREDAPVPVPEFLSNFDAQALGRCQERLRLGAAQFLRDQRQHLGVDREQTVESDVFARQRSGLRIKGRFVMDRRIIHRRFVACAKGCAFVESFADIRRSVRDEPAPEGIAPSSPLGVVARQRVIGEFQQR